MDDEQDLIDEWLDTGEGSEEVAEVIRRSFMVGALVTDAEWEAFKSQHAAGCVDEDPVGCPRCPGCGQRVAARATHCRDCGDMRAV